MTGKLEEGVRRSPGIRGKRKGVGSARISKAEQVRSARGGL